MQNGVFIQAGGFPMLIGSFVTTKPTFSLLQIEATNEKQKRLNELRLLLVLTTKCRSMSIIKQYELVAYMRRDVKQIMISEILERGVYIRSTPLVITVSSQLS